MRKEANKKVIYLPDTLPLREVISFLEEIGGGALHHRMWMGAIEIEVQDPLHGVVDYVE
jgi:hypothetical protein